MNLLRWLREIVVGPSLVRPNLSRYPRGFEEALRVSQTQFTTPELERGNLIGMRYASRANIDAFREMYERDVGLHG